MYSKAVVLELASMFKEKYGWMPEYHSIEEIDQFKKHLDQIVDIESNSRSSTITPKRDLNAKEIRWIQNERACCWMDSNYFETRYAWICDESNNIFRFKNRKSQEAFDTIIADFDDQHVAIEILLLKARQLGMSTKVALKFIHRLLFVPRTQGVMASVNEETSALLQRMTTTCLDMLPWWLPPGRKRSREGRSLEYNTGSILSIQSGAQKMGIGQGWTPTLIHISECGDFPNPKKTLEEGLMRATHPSSSLFAVYEGTGNGNTGWWADSWRTAKALYPQGRSRLCPLFLPWVMAPDLYPHPDWLRKFEVPYEFKPLKETLAHKAKCEAYIHSQPLLEKVMGKDWKMPIEQQWFWQFNYEEAMSKHTAKIWLQQMPADDYEALQGKNDSVFGQETINVITTERKKTYDVYAITGAGIDEEFAPDEADIDYDKPRIAVRWKSPKGEVFDWVLIALYPIDESDERNALGKLLIWEEPNEIEGQRVGSRNYSIGVDTAEGLGQDRAICNVTRNATDEEYDIQVAEFASDRMNAPQLVGVAAFLGAWYGNDTMDGRGAKFIIEQRRKPGDDCQLQLKRMGFFYHHRMIQYDNRKIDENAGYKEGWYTNAWSRPMLLGRFVDALENGWLKINSPFLIEEVKNFERRITTSGVSRLEHQQGKHDDRIFAQAMAYITMHHLDEMLKRAKKRYNLKTGKLPVVNMDWHSSMAIDVGDFGR